MRINELVGVKHLGKASVTDILDQLSNSNWKHLGSGGRAFVVSRSTDKVVKFWIQDEAYERFLNYIAAHPSEHFPRILSTPRTIKNFSNSGHQYPMLKYVVIERLQPLEGRQAYDVESLGNLLREVFNIRLSLTDTDFEAKLFQAMQRHGEWWEENGQEVIARCLGMLRVLVELKRNLPNNTQLDLYRDNFMMRGSTMVLTDPFIDTNGPNNDLEQEIKNNLDF